jgi:hypothetical protein
MKFLNLTFLTLMVLGISSISFAQEKAEGSIMTLEKLKSISSQTGKNIGPTVVLGQCYSHACWGKVQAVDMWGGDFYQFQLDLPLAELRNADCQRAQYGYYPTLTLKVSHPKSDAIQQALVHSINTDNYAWVDFAVGSKECLVNGVRIFKY